MDEENDFFYVHGNREVEEIPETENRTDNESTMF